MKEKFKPRGSVKIFTNQTKVLFAHDTLKVKIYLFYYPISNMIHPKVYTFQIIASQNLMPHKPINHGNATENLCTKRIKFATRQQHC